MATDYESLKSYMLAKPGTSCGYPFGEGALVFKVVDKMFGLIGEEEPLNMNLKCDPEDALALRNEHEAIIPGYHMNKKHWNTLYLDGSLPEKLVYELIDHSYDLVFASLKKSDKDMLKAEG